MKTRLPKTLFLALMSGMISTAWGETVLTAPVVTPGAIVGVDDNGQDIDVTITGTDTDKLEAWKDGSLGTTTYFTSDGTATKTTQYSKPFLKDGIDSTLYIQNVGTKETAEVVASPLYIREGAAKITNSNINCKSKADIYEAGNQLMIKVGGNNASLEIKDSSFIGDISATSIAVGGPDGSGSLTIDNSHIETMSFWAGFQKNDFLYDTYPATTNNVGDAEIQDNRYSDGQYTKIQDGDVTREYGTANILIQNNSSVKLGTNVELGEGSMTIDRSTLTIQSAISLGRRAGSSSVLNVINGGQIVRADENKNTFLVTGSYHYKEGPKKVEINVSGDNSKIDVDYIRLGEEKEGTTLNITEGGQVIGKSIKLGTTDYSGSAALNVTIDSQSSIESGSMTIMGHGHVSNSGTITVAGALTMSGGAELVFDLTALDMDNLPSLTVESLTMTDGAAISLIFSDVDSLKAALGIQEAVDAVNALTDETVVYSVTDNNTILNKLITFTSAKDLADVKDIELTLKYEDESVAGGYATYSDSAVTLGAVANAVPEPTTATLSLLALAGLCARRRRR